MLGETYAPWWFGAGIEFYEGPMDNVFLLKTAPPETCCRAALLCVMEADNAQ